MPYRRLPKTDQARIRALKAAVESSTKNGVYTNVLSHNTYYRAKDFLERFSREVALYRRCVGEQSSKRGNKEYDAAAQMWEHGWRLPTAVECQELLDNCTWRWTTHKGVNGMLVTAANGNSIFLPAAGYRDGASTITKGSYGGYWSSQPTPESDNFAGYIFFSEKNHGYDMSVRSMGLVIRPVI
jgi:hypothetical protein